MKTHVVDDQELDTIIAVIKKHITKEQIKLITNDLKETI